MLVLTASSSLLLLLVATAAAVETPSIFRIAVAVARSVSEVRLRLLCFLSKTVCEEDVDPADEVNEVDLISLDGAGISGTTCRMEPEVILHSIYSRVDGRLHCYCC